MNDVSNPLYLKCQCSCYLLEIEKFCYEKDYDEGFNISLWSVSRNSKILSFREKIRWIWNIIRTGSPWSDSIIINNKQATEIKNYIENNLYLEKVKYECE